MNHHPKCHHCVEDVYPEARQYRDLDGLLWHHGYWLTEHGMQPIDFLPPAYERDLKTVGF